MLASATPDRLYGIDTGGAVHISADAGRTWQQQGKLDSQPEAMTAHEGQLYAAVADGGIQASSDEGKTWTVRYSE